MTNLAILPNVSPLNKKQITQICQVFDAHNPHPQCELTYTTAFSLLVAIVLSAQSTDVIVNKTMPGLLTHADSPERLLHLPIEQLERLIFPTGFYRRKAILLRALSASLIRDHDGQVPLDQGALQALPGVGRKSANVFLNVFCGASTIGVDRHVLRVAARIGLSYQKTPEGVEKDLMNSIPTKFLSRISNWLVLHGRYTCKAQKPRCQTCIIRSFCQHPVYRE